MGDHEYLNLQIINNDDSSTKAPIPLTFTETRDNPIIPKCSDYYLSIIRFSLQTSNSIPLFIPQIQVGPLQNDPDLTIYSVAMTYTYSGTDYTFQSYIMFESSDINAQTPNAPYYQQDISSTYYYVNTYQQFINMINTALTSCFNGLDGLVTTAGGTLPSSHAPFMEWNYDNKTAIINADEDGYDVNAVGGDYIKVYFNSRLFTLFSSFESDYNGENVTYGRNNQIIIKSLYGNVYNYNGVNYLQAYQPYSTTALWSPVSSIVFTSGTIPVRNTNISAPLIQNSTTSLTNSGNPNIQPIITDFIADEFLFNPYLYYYPQSPYRYIDLTSDQELKTVTVSVYWCDNFGNYHQFYLNSGCSASMKLLFKRRDASINS